jgi:hypothetical protein
VFTARRSSIAGPLSLHSKTERVSPRSTLRQALFKDERGFNLAVTIAEVKAVSIFAFDLRTNPNDRDGLASCPVFNLEAEASAYPQTPRAIPNDEAADDCTCQRLKMAFDRGIDPANDLAVENGGECDPVGGARCLLDSLAKVLGRVRVTKLAAQVGGCLCIGGRQLAKRESREVSFRGWAHVRIIARLGQGAGST